MRIVLGVLVAVSGDGGGVSYVESSAGLAVPAMEGGRTEIELGDVNGDGHPDIVSIGDHGSPNINSPQHGVMVWFGDGAGAWSVFQWPPPARPGACSAPSSPTSTTTAISTSDR